MIWETMFDRKCQTLSRESALVSLITKPQLSETDSTASAIFAIKDHRSLCVRSRLSCVVVTMRMCINYGDLLLKKLVFLALIVVQVAVDVCHSF